MTTPQSRKLCSLWYRFENHEDIGNVSINDFVLKAREQFTENPVVPPSVPFPSIPLIHAAKDQDIPRKGAGLN